jgi:translation initiation factor 4A
MSFDTMDLKDELLRGIYGYGYENPSIIQQKSIPIIVAGKDLVAQSKSGTGKTSSFSIGALQLVSDASDKCQVIIVSPTRELALQTYSVITGLAKYMKYINIGLCIGGMSSRQQDLQESQIVIATPGRLLNVVANGQLNTSSLKMIVIDEADEMLSQGFIEQIQGIFIQVVPGDAQVLLFSATYPESLREMTSKFMNNPELLYLEQSQTTVEGIQQFYIDIGEEQHKFATLCDLYHSIKISQAIIYVSSKKRVQVLGERLLSQGYTVSMIHGDLRQEERNEIMQQFRSGSTRILLSSDLTARGIDVQSVNLVINYDFPVSLENYIHRIGRSGRFGRKGVAITFITSTEYQSLKNLEAFYSTEIAPFTLDFEL